MSNFINSFKASFEKNKKGIALMLFSSLCVCLGQLFWKLAAGSEGMVLPHLISGFLLYGIGAVVMILAYRYGSLSVLQPMLAANYIFSPILAKFVLHETDALSPRRLLGLVVIIAGILLIGGGDDK